MLTIKGLRALERADVVVHDRLIGTGVLRYAPPDAEFIDVGKWSDWHPVPQEEIQNILIDRARAGKRVVRLKGGDPFLFGRGGEEMEALMNSGVPCELVPGVTSAIAVPACAGISVTHRGLASSLHIVTAHRRDGESPVDYGALARLEGTLVFLMGVAELPEICGGLIAGGMSLNTPAAVIERGMTARQRRVTAPLGELAERAGSEKVEAPAVIVVGKVVALADRLDWRAALPLHNWRVVVTRSDATVQGRGRLTEILRSRGAEVLEVPCTRTETIDAPLPSLSGYAWLVFTSPTGVKSFFERLAADQRDVREIGNAKIAAVGPSTKSAMEAHGLRVNLVPPVYSGESLGETLLSDIRSSGVSPSGSRLLLLRAERGAPGLTRVLKEGGAEYDEVPLYRTAPIARDSDLIEALTEALRDTDAAAFACASSVRSFAAAWPNVRVRAACIGEQTERAACEAGYKTRTAKKATLEDLADAVAETANIETKTI
jgi:uroporphyrinogen III methyltransferase/synthase